MTIPQDTTTWKVILIGDSSVGKSSITRRLIHDDFIENIESTVGAAYAIYNTPTIKIGLWDCAGNERYRCIMPLYYRNANAGIVVFDKSNRATFNSVKYWIDSLEHYAVKNIFVVGNKNDLKSQVSDEEIKKHVKEYHYVNTSAKTGENINSLFETIASQIEAYGLENDTSSLQLNGDFSYSKTSSCCDLL